MIRRTFIKSTALLLAGPRVALSMVPDTYASAVGIVMIERENGQLTRAVGYDRGNSLSMARLDSARSLWDGQGIPPRRVAIPVTDNGKIDCLCSTGYFCVFDTDCGAIVTDFASNYTLRHPELLKHGQGTGYYVYHGRIWSRFHTYIDMHAHAHKLIAARGYTGHSRAYPKISAGTYDRGN